MSSTGRGAAYLPLGAYQTPQPVANGLVRLLAPILQYGQNVLEPSVGGGAFLRAVKAETGPVVQHNYFGIDIDPSAAGLRLPFGGGKVGDFLTVEPWSMVPTLIIGNPPFSLPTSGGKPVPAAELHIKRALSLLAPGGHLAFLLRLALLEGIERRKTLWAGNMPKQVWVLDRRPSFTGTGSDSSAYGFFLWQKGWTGPTTLDIVDWSRP